MWLLAAAAVGLVVGVVVAPAAVAADDDPGAAGDSASGGETAPGLASFGIAPAGVDRPDQRPFLAVTAPPGAVIHEHAALLNQAGTPIELQVYSGDVVMADDGLSVTLRADGAADAGSWIVVDSAGPFVVPPQTPETGFGFTVVPFTVTIPRDAEPGDHVGALVASLVTTGAGGENSPTIELEQRVAARVYITVDGAERPELVVADVAASFRPGGLVGPGTVEVSYTLRNTGNVRMAVDPSVEVAGPFGLMSRRTDGERVDELLPGGEVRRSTTVTDVWPLVREQVTVSATAVAAVGRDDPGVGTVSAHVSIWAVPWLLLGLVLLLAALVAAGVIRRRRRPRGRRVAGGRTADRRPRRGRRGTDSRPAPEPRPVPTAVGTGSSAVGAGSSGGPR